MADLDQLEVQMKALDKRIASIANRTMDLPNPKGIARSKQRSHPLDTVEARTEAEALIEKLGEVYQSSDAETRARIRAMLVGNASFDWAVQFPEVADAKESLHRSLLRLSMSDQGRDSRDALVALDALVKKARAAGINPVPVLEEIAGLSSVEDRFGMGSMMQMLLAAASRRETGSKEA